jgi:uncharacterized membrane protein
MAPMALLFERAERQRPHIPHEVVDLDHHDHYSDTHRIKGLSDGVFAIAMTLLSISLLEHLPERALSLGELRADLLSPLIVYAMTFIILGSYWVGHAIQFHYVVRSDRPLMVRTVVFLLFVGLVPISTLYLGKFVDDPIAIAIYAANLMLCGVGLFGTLLYATKDPKMLHAVFDRRIFRGASVSFVVGPVLYAVALVASFVDVRAALGLCIAVPILTFFPNPFWGRAWQWVVGRPERAE